jgi:hypothetical protein
MRYVRHLSIELTVAVAFLFSVLLLTLYLSSVGLRSSRVPYYEAYGRSLAEGRLWIQEAASPARCGYDLSFYKGKCYPYWGIFPALIHWAMPFVSDRVVTLAACSIGLYFLLKALNGLAFRKLPPAQEHIGMPFYLFVAFGTCLPGLAIAARVYEEAIAVGYAWGFAGLYFAIPLLLDGEDARSHDLRSFASSLCLVMAGLSRLPWLSVAVLLNLWLLAKPVISTRSLSWRRILPTVIPVVLGCSLQLYLNYQRFEDPFDFGMSKATYNADVIASGRRAVGLDYVGFNAIYNLFAGLPPSGNPLRNGASDGQYPWISELFQSRSILKEFALGLFVLMPSLLIGFPVLLGAKQPGKLNGLAPALLTLPLALASLAISGEVYRYQLEIYLPLLLLLIPPLLEHTRRRPEWGALHWLSLLIPTPVTLVNTLWIVKTVCYAWEHC